MPYFGKIKKSRLVCIAIPLPLSVMTKVAAKTARLLLVSCSHLTGLYR